MLKNKQTKKHSVCHQLLGSLNVLVLLGIYTAYTSKLKIVKMYLK